MPKMLDAALAYAARGWPVLPCDASKEPIGKLVPHGVTDATTNPDIIKAWWSEFPMANIGFAVSQAGLMVIDDDPGADLAQLKANLGAEGLPDTGLHSKTPRGGNHRFYAVKEGEIVTNSASKLADHVDVRGFNGYVLLPPSRTADGEYTWVSEGKPAFRTDEMVRLTNTGRDKHRDRDRWLIEPDMPENIAACIEWLKTKAKPAIMGKGGEYTAYATAAMCKSFGMSEEMAFDLMWEHWNPRNVPPWSGDEVDHLRTKVANGYSYNTSPPGNVTAAYKTAKAQQAFKPVKREVGSSGAEIIAGRFRFVDREGLRHIAPPRWIITGVLPQASYAILYGSSQSLKTFCALDIALSICAGNGYPWDVGPDESRRVWPGIAEQGNVLFAVGEGRAGIQKRVEAWETVHNQGKAIKGFILADPVPNISEDIEPFLDAALQMSPQGYKVVVLDTVGRAMQGANENAQEHASRFTRMVEILQAELGAAIICLHHTGKDGTDMRGSSVFFADADVVIRAERPNEKALHTTLFMEKQKDAELWKEPRRIAFEEITLGPDKKSLVAVAEAAKEAAPEKGRNQEAFEARAKEPNSKPMDEVGLRLLDKAIKETLAANPIYAWTNKKLSEALAMRDDIEASSNTLRLKHLVKLRERQGTYASRAYDPLTARWRHAG